MTGMAKNVPWTLDENSILLERVTENLDSRGRPRWAYVAKGLPGRTAQEARCRYRRISDAQARRNRGERFRNKCHTCGLPRRGHVCKGAPVIGSRPPVMAVRRPDGEAGGAGEDLGSEASTRVGEMPPAESAEHVPTPEPPPEVGSDYEDDDAYPALPLPIQKAPSLNSTPSLQLGLELSEADVSSWLNNVWSTSGVGEQLRRLGSMSGYIDAFYDQPPKSPLPAVGDVLREVATEC